jgi:hypothetical protein
MVFGARRAALAGMVLAPMPAAPARADYHIYSPYEIDLGDWKSSITATRNSIVTKAGTARKAIRWNWVLA